MSRSAFGCVDRAELEAWVQRLATLGIAHGPVVDAPYGSGLSFRDHVELPDGETPAGPPQPSVR